MLSIGGRSQNPTELGETWTTIGVLVGYEPYSQ